MLPETEVRIGEPLIDVMVRLGFAKSKREARYFITHGAVSLLPAPPVEGQDELHPVGDGL